MPKRISHIFLSLFLIFIIVGYFLLYPKSKENVTKVVVTDIVDDPLADFSKGRTIFNIHCAACHRIGVISDPDLMADLEAKMNKDYFYSFVTKQDSLISNKDKYATEVGSYTLFDNIAVSHKFSTLNKKDIMEMYQYILAVQKQ